MTPPCPTRSSPTPPPPLPSWPRNSARPPRTADRRDLARPAQERSQWIEKAARGRRSSSRLSMVLNGLQRHVPPRNSTSEERLHLLRIGGPADQHMARRHVASVIYRG